MGKVSKTGGDGGGGGEGAGAMERREEARERGR